jgi:hypothetical protein
MSSNMPDRIDDILSALADLRTGQTELTLQFARLQAGLLERCPEHARRLAEHDGEIAALRAAGNPGKSGASGSVTFDLKTLILLAVAVLAGVGALVKEILTR